MAVTSFNPLKHLLHLLVAQDRRAMMTEENASTATNLVMALRSAQSCGVAFVEPTSVAWVIQLSI
jgi:hypothetical protein